MVENNARTCFDYDGGMHLRFLFFFLYCVQVIIFIFVMKAVYVDEWLLVVVTALSKVYLLCDLAVNSIRKCDGTAASHYIENSI